MNKKLILAICLLLQISVIHSMKLDEKELPSVEEILATKNPLTVRLFGLYIKYAKSPTAPLPTGATFEERLSKHMLIDKWLDENGFLEVLQKQHIARAEARQVREAIEKHDVYQELGQAQMPAAQKMVMVNLLRAYKDCSDMKS